MAVASPCYIGNGTFMASSGSNTSGWSQTTCQVTPGPFSKNECARACCTAASGRLSFCLSQCDSNMFPRSFVIAYQSLGYQCFQYPTYGTDTFLLGQQFGSAPPYCCSGAGPSPSAACNETGWSNVPMVGQLNPDVAQCNAPVCCNVGGNNTCVGGYASSAFFTSYLATAQQNLPCSSPTTTAVPTSTTSAAPTSSTAAPTSSTAAPVSVTSNIFITSYAPSSTSSPNPSSSAAPSTAKAIVPAPSPSAATKTVIYHICLTIFAVTTSLLLH